MLQSAQIPGMTRNERMVSYLLFDCCYLLITHLLITKNVICKGCAKEVFSCALKGYCWFAYCLRSFRKMRKNMKDCD